jgi:hypothetical protein
LAVESIPEKVLNQAKVREELNVPMRMELGEVEPANSAGSSVSQSIGEIQQNIFY